MSSSAGRIVNLPSEADYVCESDVALKAWCRLGYRLHQEQLDLCSFYEEAGVLYLAAGLMAHAGIEKSQAETVAYWIWQYKMNNQKSLAEAYQHTHATTSALDVPARSPPATEQKRQRLDTTTEPAEDDEDVPEEEQEEEVIPPRPPDRMRSSDSWKHVLATGSDSLKYYGQLHKCKYLHEWCNQRWGTIHMSWESFNKYVDTSLSARVRLIYWLRRIWYTYHPECGKYLPQHYDSLLRRYVRDFGQDDRWEAAGDVSVSLAKWRALPARFHID